MGSCPGVPRKMRHRSRIGLVCSALKDDDSFPDRGLETRSMRLAVSRDRPKERRQAALRNIRYDLRDS